MCSCILLLYSTVDKYCKIKPTERLLSRLKAHLTPHWEDIAYELIKAEDVKVIECGQENETKKCFKMLQKWLETDSSACFCKLFCALNVYDLSGVTDKVKECIMK